MPKTKRSYSKARKTTIPYARGFKPPTERQSEEAISMQKALRNRPKDPRTGDSLPLHLRPTRGHFTKIRPPSCEDDWLAQYNEEGQSYTQFVEGCPWLSERKWKARGQEFHSKGNNVKEKYPQGKIYLLRLGDFSDRLSPSFDSLLEYVSIFYDLPVRVLEGVELQKDETSGEYKIVFTPSPTADESGRGQTRKRRSLRIIKHALESRYNAKTGHTQLHIASILYALRPHLPDDALFMIALTMFDLYSDPSDLFVAGMAAGNHRVGVFSFFRYDPSLSFSPENWYEISRYGNKVGCHDDRDEGECIILQRSCKLLIHEIGHLLGLDHCIWYECLMNGSGHLEEDFHQPMFLCPVDLHKLETLCGFDVLRRYERLRDFFVKYNLPQEEKWTRERLEYIKKEQKHN